LSAMMPSGNKTVCSGNKGIQKDFAELVIASMYRI
jgi:hypothetical protein